MEKTIYFYLFDQIDKQRVKTFMNVILNLITSEQPTCLYFVISSPGGDVESGITFHHFLNSLPCKIIMHNNGSIDSIANVIFLAGDERYSSPHTTFLFHGSKLMFHNPTEFTLSYLRELASTMEQAHEKMSGIICSKTKLKKGEVADLFEHGKSLDTGFALRMGIIREIRSFELPDKALYVSLNISPKL